MMLLPLVIALSATASPSCARLPPDDALFVIVGRNAPPPATGLAELHYADDDARRMYAAAIEHFCFRPDQIMLLVDDEATADNLLDALRPPSAPIGRLFVYVSAHGSRTEGIQLDEALDWQLLHERIDAIDARQTFVFLDTCDSATFSESRQGNTKGTVQIAPRLDEGRFYLTASNGRAFELHWLQGGVATQDFLTIIHGHGTPDDADVISSNHVCRALAESPSLAGECEQRIKGGEGVILVPDRRPPGWLQVEEGQDSGRWSYVLATQDGRMSFPIRAIDLGDAGGRKSDGLPPGDYRLRRIHADRRQCDAAGVTIVAGRTARVAEPHWTPDPGHCEWLERRESRVPLRSHRAVGAALGVSSPWLDATAAVVHVRLTYDENRVLGFRAQFGVQLDAAPPDDTVQPPERRLEGLDVTAFGAWDALHLRWGALDVYGGLEGGAGWTRVSRAEVSGRRQGLTGHGALRGGLSLRVADAWAIDVQAQAGVRSYRWKGDLVARPWMGLTAGGSIGLR